MDMGNLEAIVVGQTVVWADTNDFWGLLLHTYNQYSQTVNEGNKLISYFAHGGTVDTENGYDDKIL
jgi:hypothetical protein